MQWRGKSVGGDKNEITAVDRETVFCSIARGIRQEDAIRAEAAAVRPLGSRRDKKAGVICAYECDGEADSGTRGGASTRCRGI